MRYLQTLSIQEMDHVFGEPLEIIELPGYDDAEETEKIVARSYAANTRIVLHYSDWPNEVFRVVSGGTSNPQIVFLRGIKIGDSLSSIIDKFPEEGNEIIDDCLGRVRYLYEGCSKGYIYYDENDNIIYLRYMDDIYHYDFYFDKDEKLIEGFVGSSH